ncbi:MAG: hypothetical protein JXB88_19720 [Spirochaetales bacterium]|nr:hypothetical protein [Spirochaetales bacterium]
MKVFLGGTCNDSKWRDELILLLKIDYFNPILENAQDWDEKKQEIEKIEKEKADFCLFVITPQMTGVYSIAEAVDDSNKRPGKTLFCFLEKDGNYCFTSSQIQSLNAVKELIAKNGGKVFGNLSEIAEFLNSRVKKTE